MVILKLIFTNYKSSVAFRGSSDRSYDWLEPKIEPLLANLACTNP